MRSAREHHQSAALDGFVQALARRRERQDAIGIPVKNERGHVDTGGILAEVGQSGGHARRRPRGRGVGCDVPVGPHDLVTDALAQRHVDVVEVLEKLGQVGKAICRDALHDGVEDAAVHPLGVVGRLQEERRNRGDKDRLLHAVGAVGPQIVCDFSGAHRMADEGGLTQVELRHDRVEIGGEGVVVVAQGGLTGVAEAPAVVGDGPIPGLKQDPDLLLPGSPAQRKAVNEHNGATRAVVLVVEINGP